MSSLSSFHRLMPLIASLILASAAALASESPIAEIYRQSAEAPVVEGKDGWLFLGTELHFLAAGVFWGDRAPEVSRANKPEWADPLPAIVDFHEQLAGKGIELLVVPVPAKATIYADMLPGAGPLLPGNEPAIDEFIAELARSGVATIDLAPLLITARDSSESPLYCRTDTHWSPEGQAIVADALVDFISKRGWIDVPESTTWDLQSERIEIIGDLNRMREISDHETIAIQAVSNADERFDRDAEILLLGDSHTLVYSLGGELHAEDAGLGEHLALRLSSAIDRLGIRGSGATSARIELLRRRDEMAGKKIVIWVFAARDFTEADRWQKVPVIR